jgi:predicted MFS family arabinose efflux permease
VSAARRGNIQTGEEGVELGPTPWPSNAKMRANRYRTYVLAVLTIIFLFNYVDRVALGILLQGIKIDLRLSDSELGLLGGIAFALFYSVMGVPIARWADRGDRTVIISSTVGLWSIAVACCGAARTFAQLILIRICVAVGEAGCTPPALSLIADYFERNERPRATAIYSMGGALSTVVGFFVAGELNQLYGWRTTFALLGLPGLALALISALTIRDPRRRAVSSPNGTATAQPSAFHVAAQLIANKTFRNLLLCLTVVLFFFYGVLQWQPAFLIRSYGFTTGRLGEWLAMTYGSASLLGSYLGGAWATSYAPDDEVRQLKVTAAAVASAGVLSVLVYLSSSPHLTFALIAGATFGLTFVNGPLLATLQTLVPEEMRAMAFALVYLVANLVGMGLGPLVVGVLSDLLRPWLGDQSLRYALLIMSPGYLWGAWYALRASRTVERDVSLVAGGG